MKHNLFTWDNVQDDYGNDFFDDVVLLQQIGCHPIGTRFDTAFINYKGDEDTDYMPYLQLINWTEGVHGIRKALYFGKYKLDFQVIDVVDEPQ